MSSSQKSATGTTRSEVVPLEKIDWDRLVTVDFETYYDDAYTLSKLSTSEYIRDPRFKAQMVGIKIGLKPTKWYAAAQVKRALQAINWKTHSVLCHNTQFDGLILSHHYGIVPARYYCTLSMARGLHSNEIGAGLEDVSVYYGGEGKVKDVLETTKGVLKWSPEMNKSVGHYCAVDVDECFRIFAEMVKVFPADEMQLVHMTMRMFCNPVLRVDIPRVQAEYDREVARRKDLLLGHIDQEANDWYEQVGKKEVYRGVLDSAGKKLTGEDRQIAVAKKVFGSTDKFVGLLLDAGIPEDALPMKISKAWMSKPVSERDDSKKWSYAFAKDDLDFIDLPEKVFDLNDHLDPENPEDVKTAAEMSDLWRDLIDARLATKSTTNITRSERFLKAGANGWSLPVGYAYYRAHCVPGDTEVLTREGWVRLDAWSGGDIAQVHTDQRIEFLPATRFEGPVESAWVKVRAPYLNCDFTLGHTMPYLKQKTHEWATDAAGDFAGRAARDVPIGGRLLGEGTITPDQMRALVMVQADGSFEANTAVGRRLSIFVKKPRKIARARQTLSAAGVPHEEQTYASHPGMVRFVVRHVDYPAWLTPERKFFGAWLLDSTAEAREAFIDELQHWDGYLNHAGCLQYSSSDVVNVEWAVTMAHLTGRSASVYTAKAEGNRRANHCVSFRERAYAKVPSDSKVVVTDEPKVTYCASTRTGFWLARANGRIFVTGNTGRFGGNNKMNMQNLTRGGQLRLSILAAAGHALAVSDSGQIEARVNGWLWDQDELLDAFRASDAYNRRVASIPKKERPLPEEHEKDAYCRYATNVYGRPISVLDTDERQLGKICVLGLGYQMGAAKLQGTLAKGAMGAPRMYFPLEHVQQMVNVYRRMNYRIVEGWKRCSQIIEDMALGRSGHHKCISWGGDDGFGWIRLPNGMHLKYPDLKRGKNDQGYDEWTYQSGDLRKKIYGGLLCENLVQALARIIVMTQLIWVDKKYPIVMTTHDEGVAHCKVSQADKCYAFMHQCMTTPLPWCQDLPLYSEGGWDLNYSK